MTPTHKRILDLSRAGLPPREIGKRLGVNRRYVYRVLERLRVSGELARPDRPEGTIIDRVRVLASSGQKPAEIAESARLTRRQVYQALARLRDEGKVDPANPRSAADMSRDDAICAAALRDETGAEIADRYGISRQRVNQILTTRGISIRKRRQAAREQIQAERVETPLSTAELESIGRLLFGPAWQSALAAALKMERYTIWRWRMERSPIPPRVRDDLKHLLADRAKECLRTAREL